MLSRYFYRNELLKELGYPTYKDYLASDLWQKIRRRVLGRYRHKCQSCGKLATEVHHKHYSRKVLTGQHIIGLKAICSACHREIEFENGEKVDVVTANRRMRAIGERNGKMKRLCSQCRRNLTKGKSTICRSCKRSKSSAINQR